MRKNLSILLIEDSDEDSELIQYAIKNGGIKADFLRIETKEALLEAISSFCPDIILSDYTLPSFNGRIALEVARANCPEVPFIFVAGTLGEELAIELLKSGATDYILKNKLTKLVPAVKRAVTEKEEREERRKAEVSLQETVKKLRAMTEGTIQALSITTEIRDPYTAGHQRRVAILASAIAMNMGLDHETVDGILFAGTIHDLGKIKVPSSILNKSSKLSAAEFELLKTHPQAAYDILKVIDFPWPIADIILQHHERLDGSGYPAGLKSKAIRQESKIIMVADVVESMAFARPYRPALGLEKAFDEILQNQGSLYDRDACDVCMKLFKEKGFTFK
ncbi:MAG TPA: two-component system response regulator [Elusimicrobia bacterium]|nr:MAG: hypothetical protein A2278_07835 [Elusimicrobia bacterium RIFOXYA12_FULL_49_49]OGS11197.1 MAG: hypothetical protein A2386_06940 [Elusimicrobia bacterium RIFOXYB1_FULL_48_9]OGS16025.1 MAG: hypothetical protein A2251_02430 [Elusimicrobia bacterium RIFOXYA2_FULL_47_53]OGS25804.1 MAG: hypothetical protein A2339_05205 [Elusimicrobia bacterium RIFOXYB12_FULL_50_12]OGS30223.1 MAG: hypothetical protein A2323_02105 [Elusimicrobia bacterium RIFOXYB2_FULL_46_23]HBU69334.1 two-component system res